MTRHPVTRSRAAARWLTVAALAVIAAAVSSRGAPAVGKVQQTAQPPATLSWPDPPAPARIQFVRVLTPATGGGRPSRLRRFFDFITGGTSITAELVQPYGIAADERGRVFVADTFAETIHVFDTRSDRYSSISLEGQAPIGVATVGDRLFVTDSVGGRVTCLDQEGRRLWTIGPEQGLQRPTGIAADGSRLYVVDTLAHQVVRIGLTGQVTGRFGSHGSDAGQFNYPTNIARGTGDRLLVTDSMNFRVQAFSLQGEYLGGFGQLGDGSGDFNRPKGIALDSDGHVYVVEGLADVVQIFDERGRFLLAFGESGAREGQFWLPTGIAIRDDVIYVADAANRRVQGFRYLKERS